MPLRLKIKLTRKDPLTWIPLLKMEILGSSSLIIRPPSTSPQFSSQMHSILTAHSPISYSSDYDTMTSTKTLLLTQNLSFNATLMVD